MSASWTTCCTRWEVTTARLTSTQSKGLLRPRHIFTISSSFGSSLDLEALNFSRPSFPDTILKPTSGVVTWRPPAPAAPVWALPSSVVICTPWGDRMEFPASILLKGISNGQQCVGTTPFYTEIFLSLLLY